MRFVYVTVSVLGGAARSPLLQHQHRQYDEQLRDIAASLTRPRSRRALPPLERPTRLPPPDRLPVINALYIIRLRNE